MNQIAKQNIHILVVDDEPFVLGLTVRILNKLGYENVDTALDGNEALGMLVGKELPGYSLVICDLNMPEMDGVEFLRQAHESDYQGGLILLSGEEHRVLETATGLARDRNLRVLGSIAKPISPESLEELLGVFEPAARVEKRIHGTTESITEEELRAGITGLDRNALTLVFQPKVHIETGEVRGVETLARWRHESRGLLDSNAFVPLAESTGTIDDLTHQVYRKMLFQVSDWIQGGLALETSVNVAASSLLKPEFTSFIINTTEDCAIDPGKIILEINDSLSIDNVIDCREHLMKLRMKGFGLSVDSFGTADTSMAQLRQIPFTEMKVDHAFVHGAATDRGARAILQTSIDLAWKLDMQVVAQGVETREDWDLVAQLGCDFVQGYYCADAMPDNQLVQFINSWNGPH